MLEIVSKGFANARAAISGNTTLTEDNVRTAVRAIRVSLLEADVALEVVRAFLARVQERAVGEVVQTQATVAGKKRRVGPEEHFTRICYEELVSLMGPEQKVPIVYRRPLTVVMLVGLQGVGKTTTCGKLAKYLVGEGRRPLLVGADVVRPAAQEQLRVLAEKLKVQSFAPTGLSPTALCEAALGEARQRNCDVVVLDTAGRLAIDDALMAELADIRGACQPQEVLLVTDAMAGQDSVRTAKAFDDRLELTGLIMTKLDGDARGGAALSMKQVLNRPIKFLGTGEGLGALERFRPEGLASRILGMGDLVGLMQDFEQVVDEKKAEADAKKMLRGQFTLDDFLVQLGHLQKLGPMKDLVAKLPMMGNAAPQVDEKTFTSMRAIIQSMTTAERQAPHTIDKGRVQRIARGAGRKEDEVRGLLKRFKMMQQMMAQLRGGPGMLGKMPGLKQLARAARGGAGKGALPPGLPPGLPGAGSAGGPPGGGWGARMASMAKRLPFGGGDAGPAELGLPGMPGGGTEGAGELGAMGDGGMPFGWPPAGPDAGRGPASSKQRQKTKDRRKAERKARKKSRR